MTLRPDLRLASAVLTCFVVTLSAVACTAEVVQGGVSAAGGAESRPARVESAEPTVVGEASGLRDQPIAAFRGELLGLAFRAVSAFPLDPHVKNRSRAQESVVMACLELEQPLRARGYIDQIANWRRGLAAASLALHCAQHGMADQAPPLLEVAGRIAREGAMRADAQAWRTDRIRARIAEAYLALGDRARSDEYGTRLERSEAVGLAAARAQRMPAADFAAALAEFDAVLARGDFEQVRGALASCTKLYARDYADAERRVALRSRVQSGFAKLPINLRLAFLMELAEVALSHDDAVEVADIVGVARGMFERRAWLPEHGIPMRARLAVLDHRAGNADAARAEIDAALQHYAETRDKIVDIDRADALRPVAEALFLTRRDGEAMAVYRRAAEEGVENPNSRPRAEDLARTCCSMALLGVEPDAELWGRLVRICDGLGDPW